MTRATRRAGIAMAVAIFLLSGCKKKDAGAQDSRPAPVLQAGSGSAHVTYQSNVKIVDQQEGERAIIGQSSDGAALLFDPSNALARDLQAGDVLLVKGMLARKVLGA